MSESNWGNRNIDNKTEWGKRDRYKSAAVGIGVVDSRHHLKDDVPIYFGYDSDFQLKFDSQKNGIVLASSMNSLSDDFFTIWNSATGKIFGVTYDGQLDLKVQTSLPDVSSDDPGQVCFYDNALYFSEEGA